MVSTHRALLRVEHEPPLLPVPDNFASLVEVALADLRPVWDVVLAVEEHRGGMA